MADLLNPTVTATYACGCSFTDDTETGGGKRFSFAGDETRMFRLKLELEDAKGAAAKRAVLTKALSEITQDRKPTRAQLEALTADDAYKALLDRQADDVADDTVTDPDTGRATRFPRPPAACPRHDMPAEHTHASYLNPSDTLAAEKTP